jgi:hypothetical protein
MENQKNERVLVYNDEEEDVDEQPSKSSGTQHRNGNNYIA